MKKRRLSSLITALVLLGSLLTGAVASGAHQLPAAPELPAQTDGLNEFVWENYGVSLSVPEDWEALPRSQDYDLALVSPEALQSGAGAFVLFQVYPSLGADVTIQDALQPIAEDAGGEVEAFGDEGYGVTLTDDEVGMTQNLVLFPYNGQGAALFVQTSAGTDNSTMMLDILGTLAIDPPQVDTAAANAALQASLAEDGTLAYGDADAPVNVREYFSYTCGHCANYALPLENLFALDVEAGRVYFELAPLASDDKTQLATHATYCAAEQGQGYSVYKALFNDYLQRGFETAFTPEAVDAILNDEQYGLDVEQANTCIEDEKYADAISQVRTTFVDFGLSGTPTIVMGAESEDLTPLTLPDGQVWSGTIPLDALREVISGVIDNNLSAQEAANALFAQAQQ